MTIPQRLDIFFLRFRNDHNEWGVECLNQIACETKRTEQQICDAESEASESQRESPRPPRLPCASSPPLPRVVLRNVPRPVIVVVVVVVIIIITRLLLLLLLKII